MKTSVKVLLLILLAVIIGHHVYTNHKTEVKHDAEGNLYERWPESSHWTPAIGVERDGDWNIYQHIIDQAGHSNGGDAIAQPNWFMVSPDKPWMR
jgi:hypothetical protein